MNSPPPLQSLPEKARERRKNDKETETESSKRDGDRDGDRKHLYTFDHCNSPHTRTRNTRIYAHTYNTIRVPVTNS